MRDYGKVHSSFWTSSTIRGMSEDARTLAFYLLTSPHATIAGVFRLPDGYVCDDLQWAPERVAEGFVELFDKGFANRCETTKWVWVREHLRWNPPENPNQRKAAAKCVQAVPSDCGWKADFIRVCGHELGISEAESRNPSGTVAKPFLNQKQEQEQKQEQKRKEPASPIGSRLPQDWKLPDEWRTWAQAERPGLDVDRESASFADYWHGVAGAKGRKADWQATWRNWIRRADARPGQRCGSNGGVFGVAL